MRSILATGTLCVLLARTAVASAQFQQNTDVQFDSGTYASTLRTGSGSSVSVTLDYSGRAAGLATPGGAAWFSPSWAYRLPLVITSTNGATLTNYQVPVTVNTAVPVAAGRMRSDGGDIRLVAADGVTTIPFYILSGMNTAGTVIWVQVPSIAASSSTTVFLYYGNASASTVSSATSTFVFADDFSQADGSAPDAARWSSIFTSSATGSKREILGGRLHDQYGGYLAPGYFGVASANSLTYGSGRRYHFTVYASTMGTGQKSTINLCTSSADCFSTLGFGSSWIGFTMTHSTPSYVLQHSIGSGILSLVSATPTTQGFHTVDLLMRPGNYQFAYDGTPVISGSLTTLTPYVQLEAASSTSTLKDFYFGTTFVSQYSLPEPYFASAGAEQGAYFSTGTYTSAVLDTQINGTRIHAANWAAAVPGASGLAFSARATDGSISAAAWSAVSAGTDPGLSGRYFQYQSTFTTSDPRVSAAVSSVTFAYTSAPSAPSSVSGVAASSAAITWNWADTDTGQFAPDGFRVLDSSANVLAALGPAQFNWTRTGLTANTSYQTQVQAYNFVGSSVSALASQYTLTPPAAITPAQTTGVWYSSGTAFRFTNAAGFGTGAVSSYRYVWNTAATYTFLGTEPTWTSGTLSISTTVAGQYYLHAQPLNAVNAPAASVDIGPFLYDPAAPVVSGVSPSSSSWTSAPVSALISLSDTGGSGLAGVQYQWLTSSAAPTGGWSSVDSSISGSSGSVTRFQFASGVWYLHVQVLNVAGATGYALAGPYQIDLSSPTGTVSINGGATFTSTTNVTLNLTYAASPSAVSQVRYRNVPGAFGADELPASTRAWVLLGGTTSQTVEYQIVNQASNTATFQTSIVYSTGASLSLANVSVAASGDTAPEASAATLTATLLLSVNSSAIVGRSVTVQLLTASGTATTDASGHASVYLAVPSTAGVYVASVTFAGDSSFAAATATGAVTVTPRPVILLAPPEGATAASTATVIATLLDQASGVGVVGKTVSLYFQGSTIAATTDASGQASANFASPASSGTYPYSATYAGGARYLAANSANNVIVGRRATLLFGTAATGSVSLATTFSANLFDSGSGAHLQGKNLVFTYNGSSASALTDATGLGQVTFFPPAVGTGTYVVTFPGDSEYAADSDTPAVTVGLRTAAVTPVAVSTTVSSPFFAAAHVLDGYDSSALVGVSVSFYFQSSTVTLTTDASGYAQASFSAPASSGSYNYWVTASQSVLNATGTATGAVSVIRRTALVTVPSQSVAANAVFATTATLTDFASGNPIVGRSVAFSFQASSAGAVTDVTGSASASFAAPGGVGGYPLNGTFLGDTTYLPSTSTGTVTVNTRATTLTAVSLSTPVAGSFGASATLVETVGASPVGGKVVIFRFQGSSMSAVTDGSGLAVAPFVAPVSSGTYPLNADFTGDALYLASADTKTVTAVQRALIITPQAALAESGDVFPASATVTDALTLSPVSGLSLNVLFQGTTFVATTNGSGLAVATFTAPAGVGNYNWTPSFPGNATYGAASVGGNLTVVVRNVNLVLAPVTVVTNQVLTATATLSDAETSAAIGAQTISFAFRGSTLTANTAAGSGRATRTFVAPAATGTYTATAWFAGSATLAASTVSTTVDVINLPSSLSGNDITTSANAQFFPRETLTDSGTGLPISGATLVFNFQSSSASVVTNASGVAIATFTAPSSSTQTVFTATFAGNTTYAPAYDTRNVVVGYHFTATIPFNLTALALDLSTMTAKLIDAQTLSNLSGQSVTLNLQASSRTAVTDANGIVTSTFTVPTASGTYAINGTFAGSGFYLASNSSATLTVLTRPTFQTPSPGIIGNFLGVLQASGTFNALGQMIDANNSLGVPGRNLSVVYLGSTYTITTNGSGNWNLTALNLLTSSAASTGVATVTFLGDQTYSSSTVSLGYTVSPRITSLSVGGPTANAGLPFNIGATLTDLQTSGPLSGRTVSFVFQGSTRTGTTDVTGLAVVSFTAPASSGTFYADASYAGDQSYGPVASTGPVAVINRQSLLNVSGQPCGVMLPCGFASTLTDFASGSPIAGASVTYRTGAASFTATTDGLGVSSVTLPAYTILGATTVWSNFTGNGSFLAAYSTTAISINLRPTSLALPDINAQRLTSFQLTAELQEFTYVPLSAIAGATVSFVFNGSTYSARTDASGTVVATVTAPGGIGTYPYSATFVQDSTFTAVSSTASVIIGKRDTQLALSNATPPFSQPFIASAQLQDSGSNAISGATITFTFQGSTLTALTNVVGVASVTYVAPASTGSFAMNSYFAGNALYNASTGPATVTTGQRPTNIAADSLSSVVLSSFTARATLTDGYSGLPKATATVVFAYNGSTISAVTDASGVSTATFFIPNTSAASYSVTYLGDVLYTGSSSTGTLTLTKRSTIVTTFPQIPADGQAFTASAQLNDVTSGNPIVGSTLTFVFQGSTLTAPTDATGTAAVVFTAPAATGTYSYSSTYLGNVVYLPSSSTATVTTGLRGVSLTATPVITPTGDVFSAQATFIDNISGLPVAGTTVTFVFQGSTHTAFTNASGVATSTFSAPSSTGAYILSSNFTGNSSYAAATSNAAVTVGLRTTSLVAFPAGVYIGDAWTAAAQLIDSESGLPVSTKTISLVFAASTQTASTNASGTASVVFSSRSVAAVYPYTASFGGDATYAPASGASTLSVSSRPTSMALTVPVAYPNETFFTTATLTDVETGLPVATMTVIFNFQTSSAAAATNASGLSAGLFASPTSTGNYAVAGTFVSSGAYAGSSSSGTLTVLPRPTGLSVSNVNVILSSSFTATAVLSDTRLGAGLAATSVTFYFNGTTQTVLTDGLGNATTTFAAPATTGVFTATATYAGSSVLSAASGAGAITVTPRPTLTVGTAINTTALSPFTATAQIKDATTSSSLTGLTLYFAFNGSSQAAVTNGSGQASAAFTAPVSSGSLTFSVTYPAGPLFAVSADTEAVVIGQRPLTISLPSYNSNALSQFYATATVTDVGLGGPLVGRVVSFVFQSATETATTSGLGNATTSYFAPASIGFFPLTAATTGDATYAAAYASGTVSVQSFTSTINVTGGSAYVSSTFIASATLQRVYDMANLAGSSVVFQLQGGGIYVATTNAVGLATATIPVPASAGSYSLSATFGGDGTYLGGSSTATLTALAYATTLTPGATETVGALSVITATATLTRAVGGVLAGKSVLFSFQSGTQAATTNGSGVATALLSAVQSGTWSYTASFAGDSANLASSTATVVTVTAVGTSIALPSGTTAYTLTSFIIGSTLTAGVPIVGRTLYFAYGGQNGNATTNSNGYASAVLAAGSSSGAAINFAVTFVGDGTYQAQSATGTVAIGQRPTTLAAPGAVAYPNPGVFVASATLSDAYSSSYIAGRTLSFVYGASTQTATTNAVGLATTTFASGASSGTFTYTASLSTSDPTYVAVSSAASVVLKARPTLMATPAVSTAHSVVFTASATVTDQLAASPVAGQTVYFYYFGASSASLTNASGLATVTYNAGSSTGTYTFSATLSSGAVYAGVSSTANVVVVPRPTALTVLPVTSVMGNSVFNATATLTDVYTGTAIATHTVIFMYQTSSGSQSSNGVGQTTVPFNAGLSAGSYSYSATFLGDYQFGGQSATATVTVVTRPTTLTPPGPFTVLALSTFTASAVLRDATTLAVLPGQVESFLYQGTSQSSTTDSTGYGSYVYNAGNSSGPWTYTVTFATGGLYGGVSASGSLTVNPVPTTLIAQTTAEYTLNTFLASATLRNSLTSAPISGQTVWFNYYNGGWQSALTNAAGLAVYAYSVGASSGGPYNVVATLPSNPTYIGSSSTGTLTANPRYTSVSAPGAVSYTNGVFTASATLTDTASSTTVSGKTLTFFWLSSSQTATTSALGLGTTVFAVGGSSGTYTYGATFAADGTYLGSSSAPVVVISPRPTSLATPGVATVVSAVFTASATLTDALSLNPIPGQTVYFNYYNGGSSASVTNASGLATVTYNVGLSSGSIHYSATLSSAAVYAGVSSTGTVTAVPRPTTLAVVAAPSVLANNVFTATATLTDNYTGGSAISTRTVSFVYGTASGTALTNGIGVATVTFNAGLSSGPYVYSATYSGEVVFAAQSSTANVTVLPRPTALASVNGSPASVYASSTFTASAILKDATTLAAVPGQSEVFIYQGSSLSSATDATGYGGAVFNAGTSSGSWSFSVTLASGPTYAGVSSTASVTVLSLPTDLAVQTTAEYTLNTFTASATLTNHFTHAGISGYTVWFYYYNGGWQTATTNASGLATYSYSVGASSASTPLIATFQPTGTYLGSSSSGTMTANPRPTSVSAPGAAVYSNGVFTASATLTDTVTSAAINTKTITFFWLSSSQTATTAGLGLGTTVFAVGGSSGTYTYSATYAADPTYLGSSAAPVVVVSARPTALAAAPVTTVVSSVYTASATLTDALSSAAIPGQTVYFSYYNGGSSASVTNAAGLATVTYNVGLSSGANHFSATLSSGPIYAGVSSTGTVTTNPRPTTVTVVPVASVPANDVFTATATLNDVYTGSTISTRTVVFVYGSSSGTALTNGVGVATVTFNAGASNGSFSYSATYTGEVEFAAQSATAAVTVVRRPTALAATPIAAAYANESFVSSATLTDVELTSGLAGQTLSFSFQGASSASATNLGGLGTVTYSVPSSSGVYSFSSTFPQNAAYAFSSSTANVTVLPRPMLVAATAVPSVIANTVFTASATAFDTRLAAFVPGLTLSFYYNGTSSNSATNASGLATVTFNAGLSTGPYTYSATLSSGPTYAGQSSTANVTVIPRFTTMSAPGATAYSLGVFTASATLTDTTGGGGVSGRTVTFYYSGSSQTATTNALGLATTVYAAGPTAGAYTYAATFAADATYVGSSSAPAVVVYSRPTSLATPAVATSVSSVFTASATLTDVLSSAVVPGQTVWFNFYNGGSSASVTNASGLATVTYNVGLSSGAILYSATLSSGPAYSGVSSTGTVTASPRPTTLAVVSVPSVLANSVFTATATLTDNYTGGSAISTRTVSFVYGTASGTALTNGVGVATVTFNAGLSSGPYVYSATYSGEVVFAAQSATAAVTVAPRPSSTTAYAVAAVYVNNTFISSAVVSDLAGGGAAAQPVAFVYQGTAHVSTTSAVGFATSTFNAGASSGTYSFYATMSSGPTYGFSSSTANVNVLPRPLNLAASPTAGFVANVFTASATLTDGLSSATVSGRPVTFYYLGGSSVSLTNAAGLATVTYSAGVSSGPASFSATYIPDAVYAAASSTAVVTVAPRPTKLIALVVGSTPAIDPFSAAATLTDVLSNTAITGQTVWFYYQAGVSSAATDGTGTASTLFSAGMSSGTYNFSATLSSGSYYAGVSATNTVTVAPRATALGIPVLGSALTLSVFIASATLTDVSSHNPIAGQSVSFVFNGSTVIGGSNAAGLSTASFTTPASSGTYAVTATLPANAAYLTSTASGTISFASRLTAMVLQPTTSYALENFIATGTLTDAQNLSTISGRTVSFTFMASSTASPTNASGVSTGAFTSPNSSGTYALAANFIGDATYAPIGAGANATVLARPAGMTGAAPANVYANTVFTATATLTDLRASTAAANQPVLLTYRSQSRTVSTNGFGVAAATFTAEASTGSFTFSAAFAGDALYASSATSVAVTVQPRPTLLSGVAVPAVYVLGVYTATATLTDVLSTSPVSGRTVSFTFGVSSGASVTDGAGGAYVLFSAGSSTGTTPFNAAFAADGTYAAATGTAAVTVVSRPTAVSAPPVTAYATTVFTASATLTDVPSGGPVAGKNISFVFAGATQTVASNGSGFAATTFMAPSSSGTYALAVNVSTDVIYVGTSAAVTVTVLRRPTSLAMPTVNAEALNVFTATATLTDSLNSTAVAGATVSFVFQSSTQTGVTDVNGVAVATFSAPGTPGGYPLTVGFPGDVAHSGSFASASALVSPRPSAVAATPVSVLALDVFTGTAAVTDALLLTPIPSGSVAFSFTGTTNTVTASVAGVATSTFSAPASSGVYSYSAQYQGSSTYLSSSAVASVTVTQRPATIAVSSATAYVLSVFTATATMRDAKTSGAVAGRSLSFVIGATTVAATTDVSGNAYASLTAPGAAGVYALTVNFGADATYAVASASAALSAVTRPTSLSTGVAASPAMDPITVSAVLQDYQGAKLSGRTVSFVLFGATQTGTTDALGNATTSYATPVASGTYALSVTFNGDASYSSSTVAGAAKVQARPTTMTARSFTTIANAVFTASGTLHDVESAALLSGKNVHLHFIDGGAGQDAFVTTDANGVAATTFTAPSGTGLFSYTASFVGDATYGVSVDTGFVQIGLASTLIASDVNTIELDTFTFTAKLIDPYSQPVSSKTVTFYFRSSTRTATTDATGFARANFAAPASSGTYASSATFAGDTTYAPSIANINVNVAQRGTTLAAVNALVNVGSTVTVTARLRDTETTVGVSGKTLVFFAFGSSVPATTDASGQAAAAFSPATSSGVYSVGVSFAGDSIYAPSADVSSATVNRIPTSPVALHVYGSPSVPVNLTVQLISLADGSSLAGKTVVFSMGAASGTATTDATGLGSASFTAPASSGSYSYQALFGGDTTYAQSNSTGTLSVGLRGTGLALTVPPAPAGAVFLASATLTDLLVSTGISTETVVFTFQGSTASAVTNAFGVAAATFTAPSATGSFVLSGAFAGDSTYALSAASAPVAVSWRPVTAAATPATVPIGALFTATAAFTDTLSGLPVSTAAVVFQFGLSSAAVAGNALGVATAAFTAPASSGTFTFCATYAGSGLEAPASATGTVTVAQLATVVSAVPVAGYLNAPFVAHASLLNQSGGGPVAGQVLVFSFNGSSASVTTDVSGAATATFTAPGYTGTLVATASFAGGPVFAPASALASVTVSSRPVSIAIPSINTNLSQVFVATATLVDTAVGQPLAGAAVSFYFQGSTSVAVTDLAGVAQTTFTAPGSTGTFALQGLFSGTTVYLSTQAFASVTVSSGSGTGGTGGSGGGIATIVTAVDENAVVSTVFIASASLTLSGGGAPVVGRAISFYYGGSTVTAVTSAVGLATAPFTAPATSGTAVMVESFLGDATYNLAFTTSVIHVLPQPTTLSVPNVLTSSGSVFLTTGTLVVTASSAPLAGRSVQFIFQGTTITATTDASGNAVTSFIAPTSTGSYVLQVSYGGDAADAPVTTVAAVVVQGAGGGGSTGGGTGAGASSVIRFPSPVTQAVQSAPFTVTATLIDPSTNLGLAARALSFVFQAATHTVVTDANGVGLTTFTAPGALGPYGLSAYFIGDSTYAATSATDAAIVGLGLVPADPSGLAVTTQTATQIILGWNPVYYSVNGVYLSSEVFTYSIERSSDLSGAWAPYAAISSGTPTTLTLSTVTINTWMRVVAVSREGLRSPGLTAVHVSPYATPSRVFLSPDTAAWVDVPAASNVDLNKNGTTRSIVITTVSAPGYLFAYQLRVFDGITYDDNFTFNNSYAGITLYVSIPRAQASAAGTSAAAYRPRDNGQLALFFWSGVEWVKLGGIQNVQNGDTSINLRRTGQFAAQFSSLAGAFTLTQVSPRVFTPGQTDPNVNRARFYFQNPDNSEVNIRIFDITGATIRGTVLRENSNILYWDGTDDSGKIVKGGVYIYQIETGGKSITGTIAVAK